MPSANARMIAVASVLLAGVFTIHLYGAALGETGSATILLGTLVLAAATFRRLDPDWVPSRRDH